MITATQKRLLLSLFLCSCTEVQAQDRIFTPTVRPFSSAILQLANPTRLNENVATLPGFFGNQDQVSVSGVVRGPFGEAIPGVQITIKHKTTGIETTVITNDQGQFSKSGLAPGSYTVSASASGFGVTQRDIDLTIGQTATLDFQLGTDVPVGTAITPLRGGGSSPSRPSVPDDSPSPPTSDGTGTQSSPSKTADIFDQTFKRDIELMNWLNSKKNARKRLARIIPVTDNRSLFVFENVKASTKLNYTPMLINESLDPNNLVTRINQHADKTFIGIHRFSDSLYLMVFYD
jgi:hypothetical protein